MNDLKIAYDNWKEGIDCFDGNIIISARQPFLRIQCEKGDKEMFRQLHQLKDQMLREVNPLLSAIQYRFSIKDDDDNFETEGWIYAASDLFGTFHNYYFGRLILNVSIVDPDGLKSSYQLDIDELNGMQTTFSDIKNRYQIDGLVYASYGISNFEDFQERCAIEDMNATLSDYHFLEGLKIDIYVHVMVNTMC
jgi:hypothetical protein